MTVFPAPVAYPDPGAIFDTTADAYVRFRPEHPAFLIDHVAQAARACGATAPVLDLGCGPGVITRRLAEQGLSMIAIDPNEEMLAAGRQLGAHLDGIDWRCGDSTTLLDLPRVRGAVIGDAFHYMDRNQVLQDLDDIILPGGFVAVVVSHALGTPKAWWEPILDHIRDQFLGTHRAAGAGVPFQYLFEDHETVMRRSAFSWIRMLRVDYRLDLTIDELIGLQYTYAFSSPAVLGAQREDYEDALRQALRAVQPSERFTVTLQAAVIIGHRSS
ncbi:class I SAM-dependent methyltransferase [Streptosporangium sp. NPDC003464]